ncbi:LysR family transcriptional regulator [Undibacterium sp. SXout11W]|uniref:LysR family transcriptional regulator n=1 Tax=Undibacterium sp. SXout11W TaxID=3413050 RepID=UPI003BF3A35B
MHITLRQLEVFVAIARAGTGTAAASQLALSQSAASSALSDLEYQLGEPLFNRVGKRLQLNENGRYLLPKAEALLEGASEIEQSFKAGVPVRLRLYASMTIGNDVLPGLAAQYLRQEPDSRLEIAIGNSQDVVEAILSFRADFGLIEAPCHDSRLVAEPWLHDQMQLFCHASHPLAHTTPDIAQLQQTAWVLREPGSGSREVTEAAFAPHLGVLNSVLELGSAEAIARAVGTGLGIACVSNRAISDKLASGEFAPIHTPWAQLNRRFYLVCHQEKILSGGLQRFRELCRLKFIEEMAQGV